MNFPGIWETAPLESLADIGSGITKGRKANGTTRPIPYLRVANVQAGHIDLTEVKDIDATDDEMERFGLEQDDILMTEGGDPDKLGRGALWDGRIHPCIHQNHIFRVRLDKQRVYPPYFARVLGTRWAVDYFLKAAKQTTGIATINKTQLRGFPVPLPPLPEQKRIAAILDKADAIRRKRQEAIRLTEELLRSAFLEMFGDPVTNPKGWEVKKLGEVIAEAQYGTAAKSNTDGVGLPVLRMNNITYAGEWDLSDLKHCEIADAELDKYTTRRGDLLFNRTNSPELVGKTAVWERDEAYAIAGYLIRVRFTERANPWYVGALLNGKWGKQQLRERAKASNNMSNFSASELKRLEVPLPSEVEQERFAQFATSVRAMAPTHLGALRTTEELLASLTQRAFCGML